MLRLRSDRIDTVVIIQCCQCNGNGDHAATPYGAPGVPWRLKNRGSNSCFVCLEHALDVHCRSCATPLGIEAYLVDPEVLNNDESSTSEPQVDHDEGTPQVVRTGPRFVSAAARLEYVADAPMKPVFCYLGQFFLNGNGLHGGQQRWRSRPVADSCGT